MILLFNQYSVLLRQKENKMARKELVNLLEKNILLFAKLSERINRSFIDFGEYSRTQVQLLVRLYLGGKTRLKDLAERELISAPNLCAAFKKMEANGLVLRVEDENDRRNMWYSVTEHGARTAIKFVGMFHQAVATMFKDIDKNDEDELVASLKSMHDILLKMEAKNA